MSAPKQYTQYSGGVLKCEDGTFTTLDKNGQVPQPKASADTKKLVGDKSDLTAEQLALQAEANKAAADAAEAAEKARQDAANKAAADAAEAAEKARQDAEAQAKANADKKDETPPAPDTENSGTADDKGGSATNGSKSDKKS